MTSQIRHIIFFSILALLSFAVWKYYFFKEEIIQDKPFTKGYSVEDIELKITDEQGEMSAKFTSPNLIRYTDSPIIHINSPLFWTYTKGEEKWLITAKDAQYNTVNDEVELQENLVAKTINSDTQTSFTAKNLTVNLKTKLAHTEDGIFFKQQQLNMQGQIAKFDLNNETLEVNKNVKAIYKAVQ